MNFSAIQQRRQFLQSITGGIGTIALGDMLARNGYGATAAQNPLAPRKPHFAPKAKRVIFLFQEGAPSQMDLCDLKAPRR